MKLIIMAALMISMMTLSIIMTLPMMCSNKTEPDTALQILNDEKEEDNKPSPPIIARSDHERDKTIEKLQDQIENLTIINTKLQKENDKLKKTIEQLTNKLAELQIAHFEGMKALFLQSEQASKLTQEEQEWVYSFLPSFGYIPPPEKIKEILDAQKWYTEEFNQWDNQWAALMKQHISLFNPKARKLTERKDQLLNEWRTKVKTIFYEDEQKTRKFFDEG